MSDGNPNIIYKATLPEDIDSGTTLAFTEVYDLGEQVSGAGLFFDPVDQLIYWGDYSNEVISRCDLNGGSYSEFDANGKLSRPRS